MTSTIISISAANNTIISSPSSFQLTRGDGSSTGDGPLDSFIGVELFCSRSFGSTKDNVLPLIIEITTENVSPSPASDRSGIGARHEAVANNKAAKKIQRQLPVGEDKVTLDVLAGLPRTSVTLDVAGGLSCTSVKMGFTMSGIAELDTVPLGDECRARGLPAEEVGRPSCVFLVMGEKKFIMPRGVTLQVGGFVSPVLFAVESASAASICGPNKGVVALWTSDKLSSSDETQIISSLSPAHAFTAFCRPTPSAFALESHVLDMGLLIQSTSSSAST